MSVRLWTYVTDARGTDMGLFDVRVMNDYGVWETDTVTGSKNRARDRARYLVPRTSVVQIEDEQGQRVPLDDEWWIR
jgi:hypothetical protein